MTLNQHNRQWSAAVFADAEARTPAEFIAYTMGDDGLGLDHWYDSLCEYLSECASEIAMFGDSGPGTLYRARLDAERFRSVCARLRQFGVAVPDYRIVFPSPR